MGVGRGGGKLVVEGVVIDGLDVGFEVLQVDKLNDYGARNIEIFERLQCPQ